MINRRRKELVEITIVPTKYLLWMNEQLDKMIDDVKKMNKDLGTIKKINDESKFRI